MSSFRPYYWAWLLGTLLLTVPFLPEKWLLPLVWVVAVLDSRVVPKSLRLGSGVTWLDLAVFTIMLVLMALGSTEPLSDTDRNLRMILGVPAIVIFGVYFIGRAIKSSRRNNHSEPS